MDATLRALKMLQHIKNAHSRKALNTCLQNVVEDLGGDALLVADQDVKPNQKARFHVNLALGTQSFFAALDELGLLQSPEVKSITKALSRPTTIEDFRIGLTFGDVASRLEKLRSFSSVSDLAVVRTIAADEGCGTLVVASTSQKLDPDAPRILNLLAPHVHAAVDATAPERNPGLPLSVRERECLQWTAHGKTSVEIAVIVGTTARTVDAHVNAAMYKLSASSRTQAVALALRAGIIV
jgi:DNA-binding CsgD family transcriptional regulator